MFKEQAARNPAFPLVLPSTGDSPEFEYHLKQRDLRQDSPLRDVAAASPSQEALIDKDIARSFAPPG